MKTRRMVVIVISIVLGILMAWGGSLYALENPEYVKIIGLIIVIIGYGILFGAVFLYENETEE